MFTGGNYMKPGSGRALAAIKVAVLIGVVLLAISLWLIAQKQGSPNSEPPASTSVQPAPEQPNLQAQFKDVLASYRKVIVLLANESALSAAEKDAANQIGQRLFHENLARIDVASGELDRLVGF